MTTAGTQIALGVLQLVALSLPVFALLAQVYFTVSDDNPTVSVSLRIAFGGGFLVLAGMVSGQFLYINTESFLIQTSIALVILGLFFILVVLKGIYEASRQDLQNSAKETVSEVDKIIRVMEENEFETIREFEESDVTLKDLDNNMEPTRLDDLRSQKRDAEEVVNDLETPITDYFVETNFHIIAVLTIVLSIIVSVSQIPFSGPLFVIYPLIASHVIVFGLEWLGILE
jgi:hypothetical protein